jgi:hypothetical protein
MGLVREAIRLQLEFFQCGEYQFSRRRPSDQAKSALNQVESAQSRESLVYNPTEVAGSYVDGVIYD